MSSVPDLFTSLLSLKVVSRRTSMPLRLAMGSAESLMIFFTYSEYDTTSVRPNKMYASQNNYCCVKSLLLYNQLNLPSVGKGT